jgi:tetratricopeptide (TPR) repeat protein
MDLAQRLSQLESVRDWQSLAEELEKAIAAETDAAPKAAYLLRLGQVLEEKFLQSVKALKCFQDAYKLNPELTEALDRSRSIFWDLGKTQNVQKILTRELKSLKEGPVATAMLIELGDLLVDGDDIDKATSTYARAVASSGGASDEARLCLEDVQVDEAGWQAHVASLLQAATGSPEPAVRSRLYLRAARVARRFAPSELEGLLAKAYEADPTDKQAAALFEGLLAQEDRLGAIAELQRRALDARDGSERAAMAFKCGLRWATRHQDLDRAASLLDEALADDPTNEAAFIFLRELWGSQQGSWDRVMALAERSALAGGGPFMLAQAGTLAWQKLGNLLVARQWFEKLAAVSPDHPMLTAFELQIGEPVLRHGAEESSLSDALAGKLVEPPVLEAEEPIHAAAPVETAVITEAPVAEAPVAEAAAPVVDEAVHQASPEMIAELLAKAEKQEHAKRYNEYVKTLIELAEAVPEQSEKIGYYVKASELYTGKFSNTAEAIKCNEAILALDPEHAEAIDFLRQSYEKRRDWEKLVGLMKQEATAMAEGALRGAKFLEIATLATDKIKKPEVCIELWNEVLNNDPESAEALSALAGLYERAKEYAKLAEILEKQVETTLDSKAQEVLLGKLGHLYGDRLDDDNAAVRAWQKLLALDPADRKAQEALKKKYLALGRWDDLELFYAESGKWDEFIRVLEAQEAKETDDLAKIGLLLKTAELWITQKGKADRAARAYEKVLGISPNHLGAAEALIPIHTQTSNFKGLASAIEVKLFHDLEPTDKLALYREVAVLYETKLKEPELAFERYKAAFQLVPSDAQCSEDIERSAGATGAWESVIGVYTECIASAEEQGEVELGVDLRLRLGRVLVQEVARIDEALAQFRAVYDADNENSAALTALEGLYRNSGRNEELLEIFEKKRDLAADPAARKASLYAIAELYENKLADKLSAITTYNQVLDDEPMDGQALAALDRLYFGESKWEDYADILTRRIGLDVAEEQLIDFKLRLGAAQEKHLGDAASALENYREVLFLDAANDAARGALEALLDNADLRSESAAILEEIYETRGDWEKLISAREILAACEPDVGKRVALLRKIARTAANELEDLARAFEAQARALRDDPSDAETRSELEALAQRSSSWGKLDLVFAEIAEGLSDAQLAREYWLRLAGIHEKLGKIDDAAAGYLRVLALDPADQEALAALDTLYRNTERYADLIGVFRRRIELAIESSAREELYGQMAVIYEERLGRPEDAIAGYREVLDLDGTSQAALTALDGLFTRQAMWSELAENLEAQLNLATTEEDQLRLMLRLAALRESKMALVEPAIETYREVIERDPSSSEALLALERLGKMPEHELLIAEVLEPLYRQSGDYQKLIGVHEVQVRRSEEPAQKVELLHRIAQLHEDAGGDLGAAFDSYARALAEDPGSEPTQEALDRLARATSRFADLARVFEVLAKKQEDAELASTLYTMSARVFENDLGDLDSSVRHYTKVLELDSRNLGAAESLERIFSRSERYPELSKVLQQKAELLDDLADRKAALFQAASIEVDILEHAEDAIAVYGHILELDPEEVRAIDALIQLYLAHSRWQDLLAIYGKKADLVSDPDEKKQIFYQIGAVYERELSDVERAIGTYERVLELDPDDVQALGRLDVLYQTVGNWAELLSVLEHEAELASDPAEGVGYQYRIAEVYEKHREDPTRAIELYRELLEQMPNHAPTLAALENLKSGTTDALGAALVLEPIYEDSGDWLKLISVLEVQVQAASEAYAKVELLHRVARLHEDMLGDHASSFATYARAVALDLANEDSLQNLERLAMAVERWPAVAALYDAELDKLVEDRERYVELGLRLAQIFETQLEDVGNAIARYRKVLAVDGENQEAVSALDRLFVATEQWSDLAQILVRQAEIGQNPDDVFEFKYRLGQVHQLHLNDLPHAIASYREILAAAPEHTKTLVALEELFALGVRPAEIAEIIEPLYQASGEWEKLSGVLEASLAQLTELPERAAMYYRLAELYEERLVSLDGALGVYIRAVKEIPSDEKVLEELERLAGSVDGGWEALANAYADVLGLHADKTVQSQIGMRLARVFEEELGDITKAEETYRYVVGVEPLQADALANLDRIYTQLEQFVELAQVLDQRVRTTQEPYELIELYGRLGEVSEVRLGQLPQAIAAFRKIFDELDPANDEAIQALERIYGAQGAWTELHAVLLRELDQTHGDAEEADIRAKLAHVLADRLNDLPAALETWKRVLDLRGEDPEALGALANLHERQQQWAELCDVLERHYDIAPDDEQRVNVLLRRARLFQEQLGRTDTALEDYIRVLDVDYSNLHALYAIAAIWRERGDAQEIVNALHQTADRAAAALPAENLVALYRELGTLYQQSLAQPFDAIDAWRKLLEIDPRDFEAMAALENLLRADERWTEVIDVKMGRALAYESPTDQVREYLEVAQIWENQVGDKDKGTLALEKILAIDELHDEAFLALEELHGAAHRSEPLIELYLARLDTREDLHERTSLLRKVAKVFEEQLDDKPQAFDALLTAFEMDFGDKETVRFLERMAQATNRWPELVQAVNGWLLQQTEPAQRISLCLRLSKWYAEDLALPEHAQVYYQQILALDPNNVAVLRQMANFFKKGGQWQQQGQTLTSARAVAVSDVDRKEILTELGEVLERRMGEVEQGLAYYKQALDVDPLHVPALEALERIYTDRDQHAELVDVLVRKAKGLTNPEEIASAKLRTGGLYETTLGQLEKAGQVYREVLELDAASLLAMRGLERVYVATQQWPDLIGVLEMQLDVVNTERERIDVLAKLANIQEVQFLKPDLAAIRLEQIVEIDPNNEEALSGLERCYRRLRQWLDLVSTFDRHINATLDRETKIALWGATAKVYADEVQDLDRAIDAYLNVVDIDGTNLEALDALAKLYERQEDPAKAIDYMTQVADLTADGKQRVEMYSRIGRQLDEKLGDRMQAQERYEMALDLDPTHLPTLAALRVIAVDSADWDRAARYLDQEQLNTPTPRARARLLVELGKLREEMIGEHELAIQAYELALQCDPDNEDAAMPLCAEYVATEQWERAELLAEMLAKKSGKRERNEQHQLHNQLGKVLSALGKLEGALKAYQVANHLDLTAQDTIRGLADVSFKLGDWPGALTNYQKVLTSLGEEEIDERATIYFRLGSIKQAQGQGKQAINNFEKALALDAAHRPTLDALVQVYEGAKDWKQVCHYKRQILDNVYDGAERFRMLNEIGDIWSDKENNPLKGIEALEEALDLEPTSHVLLHKLLQLYQKGGLWTQMVDALQRIAEMEANPERKSRYLYTMAQLYRDKLEDPTRAIELFNESLDLNPGFLEAFERINKILTAQKDWQQLGRAYRKMLGRIQGKGNTELEYKLWHALGLIYRDRLQDPASSVTAFQNGSFIKPDDVQGHQILAELYESLDQLDGAIGEYQMLLKLDAMNVDTYRKLYGLYLTKKAYDEAWCLAGALAFLRKADEEEQRFFEDYRPEGMLPVKNALDVRQWENLFHEDEDRSLGKIFEAIAGAALKAKIEELKVKKELPVLPPDFRQDLATSTATFPRSFGWAAHMLGLQAPVLYVRSDVPGSLIAVAAEPPSSVAGQTVLMGLSQPELTFIVAKHLAMYRGEHYIKTLFPTVTELTLLAFAGMKIIAPETPVPPDMAQRIVATAQQLRGFMQPIPLEGLRIAVKNFNAETMNVRRWSHSVDITAARAGLLLSGDLEVAKKIIAAEPQQPGDLSPQEKMKELLLFSVSERYFALRRALGVAIAVEG